MLYIIYQEDGPNSAVLREQHKPAHFEYLDAHADSLVLGGAMHRPANRRRRSPLGISWPTGIR